MTTISVPFEKLGDAIGDDVERNIRKILLSMFAHLDSASPIGRPQLWKGKRPKNYRPGWFKANWKIVFGPTNDTPEDKLSRGRGNDDVRKFVIGIETHILNNVPYAERLGKGWSTQAPMGWIETAIRSGIRNA